MDIKKILFKERDLKDDRLHTNKKHWKENKNKNLYLNFYKMMINKKI